MNNGESRDEKSGRMTEMQIELAVNSTSHAGAPVELMARGANPVSELVGITPPLATSSSPITVVPPAAPHTQRDERSFIMAFIWSIFLLKAAFSVARHI